MLRSSEETLNLITELVEDRGGEFNLWFEDRDEEPVQPKFVAMINFEGGSGSYTGTGIVCAQAINEMIDKALKGEKNVD